MTNRERFENELRKAYEDLFANDPDYAYSAARTTPALLAERMTAGLLAGTASKEGKGIRRACKACGIPHTYKAIRVYLADNNNNNNNAEAPELAKLLKL